MTTLPAPTVRPTAKEIADAWRYVSALSKAGSPDAYATARDFTRLARNYRIGCGGQVVEVEKTDG
jgi:hypothetical protein